MGGPVAALLLLLSLHSLIPSSSAAAAFNITKILDAFPHYSTFNQKLSETKLNDDINSRTTISVLALSNSVISSLSFSSPAALKDALSLHVLLDYYNKQKLHSIQNGSAIIASLFQSSGNANGLSGFVNITLFRGDNVSFLSAAAKPVRSANLSSFPTFVKDIKTMPYNISVIEVSALIRAPGVDSASAPSPSAATSTNITATLEKHGCKIFADLLVSSGVIKSFESAAGKGLTVFGPIDAAFQARGLPDLKKLSKDDQEKLLEYHASDSYLPMASLKATKGEIETLASDGAKTYEIQPKARGQEVSLDTGVNSSKILSTVVDETPLVIFTVDSVLLPFELFGKGKKPKPAPAPSVSPAAGPAKAPAPEPAAGPRKAPAPKVASPPAPPTAGSPGGSPADSPDADSPAADSAKSKAAAERRVLPAALVSAIVAATVIFSSLLS